MNGRRNGWRKDVGFDLNMMGRRPDRCQNGYGTDRH